MIWEIVIKILLRKEISDLHLQESGRTRSWQNRFIQNPNLSFSDNANMMATVMQIELLLGILNKNQIVYR